MTEVSRQRRWQLKMVAEARCPKCGGDRGEVTTRHCEPCNAKMNEIARRLKAERSERRRRRNPTD